MPPAATRFERLGAGRSRHDLVFARGQHRLQQADVLRQVVDDQYRRARAVASWWWPRICATWCGNSRTSSGFSM